MTSDTEILKVLRGLGEAQRRRVLRAALAEFGEPWIEGTCEPRPSLALAGAREHAGVILVTPRRDEETRPVCQGKHGLVAPFDPHLGIDTRPR